MSYFDDHSKFHSELDSESNEDSYSSFASSFFIQTSVSFIFGFWEGSRSIPQNDIIESDLKDPESRPFV